MSLGKQHRWGGVIGLAGFALALCLVLLAGACRADVIGGASVIAAGPAATSSCDRPSSTTLLETATVRVYAMPKESSAHLRHGSAIAGRPVFACLRSTGRSWLLDLPELAGEGRAYWLEVDSRTVAANGQLVAYAYTQYYFDTHKTWIRVRNLNTGKVTKNCYVGGGRAPHRGPRVIDIILISNGEVTWRAEGEESGASDNLPPGCSSLA